jgi:imidazolonepropionase-like amidohydrolase
VDVAAADGFSPRSRRQPAYAAAMPCRALLVECLAASLLAVPLLAQGPPPNGPRTVDGDWFALRNARVVAAPGQAIDSATVVFRRGRITAVSTAAPPAGATVIDCTGLSIYAGLVEPFHPSDVPALDPTTTDRHWNPLIQPQRRALDGGLVPAKERATLRRLGFAAAAAAPSGGILKGTAAVVLLDEPEPSTPVRVLRSAAYQLASLQTSRDGYPDSEMGAVALLRQMLLDGRWYERNRLAIANDASLAAMAPAPSAVLAALVDTWQLPLWFDCQDELQALRLSQLATEFERPAVLIGSGMEFRRAQALGAERRPIVVPLFVPDPPDVATAGLAERVSLRQLQSWEQAPTNSKRLLDQGLTIAWSTARMREPKEFLARARDAIACGVTADQALAAVTTAPASLLGLEAELGTVAVGKWANLCVTTGDLFAAGTEIRDVFVGGVRHRIDTAKDDGMDGTWLWRSGLPFTAAQPTTLEIRGDSLIWKHGDTEGKSENVQREPRTLTCRLRGGPLGDERCWLRLHVDGEDLVGTCTKADGSDLAVAASRTAPATAKAADAKQAFEPPSLAALPTPLGGYGFAAWPEPATFVIQGAMVWPCDGRPPIANGAVWVRDGRIVFAGPTSELPGLPNGVQRVDGTGKHVTPGLIDCHSHTGIRRGVNESGQAVTAEVRIQDVLDPDDVNWYRQLAGGVTAVNQLHGSANAIGGQSQTTKNRWGAPLPDAMQLEGAVPGIKWALGENPRRANGSGQNSRYPTTRMGVEALLRDRFAAAKVYREQHAAYEALAPVARAKVLPPRRDLELEALAEVLAKTRLIHCHSYRQDEIFMLCGLAQEHGLRIGTFQHVLEGYKVADAIAANGAGASSFTDWWAYKLEVQDAIPDNGAILFEQGVLVSFNSDSNEHARRLNSEAGKAVKYGGVAPADALLFVTANPAKQLGIFERTGSLTAGKDADIALWSDHPLGYAARCEGTWVDGRPLFSRADDADKRSAIRHERQRLLQKVLAAGPGKKSREGDDKDAYWAAEDRTESYCCREHEGGR